MTALSCLFQFIYLSTHARVNKTVKYTISRVHRYVRYQSLKFSIPSPGFAVLTQLPCPLALQRADRRRGRGLVRVRVRVKGRGLGLVRVRVTGLAVRALAS